MSEDRYRFFIELQIDGEEAFSRQGEAQARRALAERFVSQISSWIQEEELRDKVASIAITALGQVLITCERDIIVRIREDETHSIAAIRSGATLTESLSRIAGW